MSKAPRPIPAHLKGKKRPEPPPPPPSLVGSDPDIIVKIIVEKRK